MNHPNPSKNDSYVMTNGDYDSKLVQLYHRTILDTLS